ncbi:MAG: DUF3500 domain-containing protein, partial [Planctomycetaceae bacterium]
MNMFERRRFLASAAVTAAGLVLPAAAVRAATVTAPAIAPAGLSGSDSLAMQLYKSLSDEQRARVCLPADHPRRQYVSNWWYIHPDYRIPATFSQDQQELIQRIFDSLHSAEYLADVKKQVRIDQYGQAKNAPAAGFFGTPDSPDFEFIYTGHHIVSSEHRQHPLHRVQKQSFLIRTQTCTGQPLSRHGFLNHLSRIFTARLCSDQPLLLLLSRQPLHKLIENPPLIPVRIARMITGLIEVVPHVLFGMRRMTVKNRRTAKPLPLVRMTAAAASHMVARIDEFEIG